MRYLRQFCAVTMLVCAFAFSAYAGDIPCPGITSQQPAAAGYIPNGVTAAGDMPTGGITETVILLLLALV